MNCLLLFLFPTSGDLFSSVFLRQVSVDKLCLSWHFWTSVPPYSNWRDEAFWTGGGTASGFQAPGRGSGRFGTSLDWRFFFPGYPPGRR